MVHVHVARRVVVSASGVRRGRPAAVVTRRARGGAAGMLSRCTRCGGSCRCCAHRTKPGSLSRVSRRDRRRGRRVQEAGLLQDHFTTGGRGRPGFSPDAPSAEGVLCRVGDCSTAGDSGRAGLSADAVSAKGTRGSVEDCWSTGRGAGGRRRWDSRGWGDDHGYGVLPSVPLHLASWMSLPPYWAVQSRAHLKISSLEERSTPRRTCLR